jgi:hypothetical protein
MNAVCFHVQGEGRRILPQGLQLRTFQFEVDACGMGEQHQIIYKKKKVIFELMAK